MDRKWLAIGQIAKRRRQRQRSALLRAEGADPGTAQRRRPAFYPQDALRRIAFIRVAQGMGLSLDEIRVPFAACPMAHAGSPRLGADRRPVAGVLDRRIEALQQMRRSAPALVVAVCRWSIAPFTTGGSGCRPGKGPRYLLGTSRRRMTGRRHDEEMRPRRAPGRPRLHRQGGKMALESLKRELEPLGEQHDEAQPSRDGKMLNITRDTGELLALLVQTRGRLMCWRLVPQRLVPPSGWRRR